MESDAYRTDWSHRTIVIARTIARIRDHLDLLFVFILHLSFLFLFHFRIAACVFYAFRFVFLIFFPFLFPFLALLPAFLFCVPSEIYVFFLYLELFFRTLTDKAVNAIALL